MLSTSDFERSRLRLERLFQVVSSDYSLRVEGGSEDELVSATVKLDANAALLDHDALLGKGLHQLTHMLHTEKAAFELADAAERGGKPGFSVWWHSLEDARSANRFIDRYPAAGKWLDAAFVTGVAESDDSTHSRADQVSLALYLCGRGWAVDRPESSLDRLLRESAPIVTRAAAASSTGATLRAIETLHTSLLSLCDISPFVGRKQDAVAVSVVAPGGRGGVGSSTDVEEGESQTATIGEMAVGGSMPWFSLGAGQKAVHPTAESTDGDTIEIPLPKDPERLTRLEEAVQEASGRGSEQIIQLALERDRIRWSEGRRRGQLNGARLWRHRVGDRALFRVPAVDPGVPAIVILLDESASTAQSSVSTSIAATGLFAAQVLERLRVPFEVIGFTTDCFEAEAALRLGLQPYEPRTTRCSKLRHRLYKAFDEEFRMVRQRLTAHEPGHNNWDEEHLGFAARRLARRPERRRMIFIVGDGQPNGEASVVRDTVSAIEKQGTVVAAVGVGSDYVSRVYQRHRVGIDLPDVVQGAAELIAEFVGRRMPTAGAA